MIVKYLSRKVLYFSLPNLKFENITRRDPVIVTDFITRPVTLFDLLNSK